MFKSSQWIVTAGISLLVAISGEAKLWTDRLGRTFEAEFVRVDGAQVILKLPNDRVFGLPLSDLNEKDRNGLQGLEALKPSMVVSANFTSVWPKEVRLDGAVICKTVKEDPATNSYIYESPNYRFTCDARVTDDALRNFSVMFETTRKYAKALPLGMAGKEREGKLDIYLFATMQGYLRAGGMYGSAGCYCRGVVFVPMESLGLRRGGTGFGLDSRGDNAVLVHELTHQLTPDIYLQPGVSGWFGEGLAEYLSSTPYTWGFFRPDSVGLAAKAYIASDTGRGLGTKLQIAKLRDFMLQPYQSFAGGDANFNYSIGLLLTHYFIHMEGGGKSTRLIQFLKGLQNGAKGEAALAPLLGGGSYEKLEGEIRAAWGKLGVEIKFGE
jgi:hypothetical protein